MHGKEWYVTCTVCGVICGSMCVGRVYAILCVEPVTLHFRMSISVSVCT